MRQTFYVFLKVAQNSYGQCLKELHFIRWLCSSRYPRCSEIFLWGRILLQEKEKIGCLVNKVGGYLHNAAIRQKSCTIHGRTSRGIVMQKKKKLAFSRHCGLTLEIRSNKLLKHIFFVDQTLLTETFSTSFWSSAYRSETFWLSVMIPFFTPYVDIIFHCHSDNPRTHLQSRCSWESVEQTLGRSSPFPNLDDESNESSPV